MRRAIFLLAAAGFAFAGPRKWSRDLFGFAEEGSVKTPFGYVPHANPPERIAPFWNFRTDNSFVYNTKVHETIPRSIVKFTYASEEDPLPEEAEAAKETTIVTKADFVPRNFEKFTFESKETSDSKRKVRSNEGFTPISYESGHGTESRHRLARSEAPNGIGDMDNAASNVVSKRRRNDPIHVPNDAEEEVSKGIVTRRRTSQRTEMEVTGNGASNVATRRSDSNVEDSKRMSRRSDFDDGSELLSTDIDPEPPRREEEFISDHEQPRDVPTRPEHGVPGSWAKGEVPGKKKVELDFVPLQIYSQVRRYDLEERLPKERAAEEAENEEELLAAPRLREVLRNKKLHEIYEEEGYEDLGYDHGGYNHKGVKVEVGEKNEDGAYRKLPPLADAPGVSAAEAPAPTGPMGAATDHDPMLIKSQSAYGDIRSSFSSATMVGGYSNVEHKVAIKGTARVDSASESDSGSSSTERSAISDRMDVKINDAASGGSGVVNIGGRKRAPGKVTFPGNLAQREYTSTLVTPIVVTGPVYEPQVVRQVASFLPGEYSYETAQPASFSSPAATPAQFASAINAYASLINQNITSPLREHQFADLEHQYRRSDETDYSQPDDLISIRINVTPNPETTTTPSRRRGSRRKEQKVESTTKSSQPTRRPKTDDTKKSSKVYSNLARGTVKYNPEEESQNAPTVGTENIRHPSLPFDTGNDKVEVPTELSRTPEPKQEHVAPTKDPAANAKYVEQLTLAHYSSPVNIYPQQAHLISQEERLKQLAKQLNAPVGDEDSSPKQRRRKRGTEKHDRREDFPYYDKPPAISKDSPLKYATNPSKRPEKTPGGMEFYASRERVRCDGPHSPKNVTPKKEAEGEWDEEPVPKGARVKGVGKAIDCFKKKYFGSDPLDNPLFKEESVDGGETHATTAFEKTIPYTKEQKSLQNKQSKEDKTKSDKSQDSDEDKESENASDQSAESEESDESDEDKKDNKWSPFPQTYGHQYAVYESVEEPKPHEAQNFTKFDHYYSLDPKLSKAAYLAKRKKYIPYPLVMKQPLVYSIVSNNDIPPHHAPLLIPENANRFLPLHPHERSVPLGHQENIGGVPIRQFKKLTSPKVRHLPPLFSERAILIRKRQTEDLWDVINPIKWVWPSYVDARRREPRYRRSIDLGVEAPPEESTPSSDAKSSTITPISLAEFKVKFNIPDQQPEPKKVTTRLTGGFLNRNPDITDAIEMRLVAEPTEPSSTSTVPTTTSKPKVVFPRAKIPRVKTYTPKRTSNVTDVTTEGSTTTSTTTLPTTTTTRMYKPKRVIKKNFGKGPFDAFTVLKVSREQTTELSVASSEYPGHNRRSSEGPSKFIRRTDDSKSTKKEEANAKTEETNDKEPEVTTVSAEKPQQEASTERSEGDTLTYMVNPVTGEGKWSEERRWKPKKKRVNRPSIYSFRNITQKKKQQRAVPDRTKDVYHGSLLTKLDSGRKSSKSVSSTTPGVLNYGAEIAGDPTAFDRFLRLLASTEPSTVADRSFKPTVFDDRSPKPTDREADQTPKPVVKSKKSKQSPKYILQPDKRRYFYVKV